MPADFNWRNRSTDWGASWTIVSAPSLSNVLMATPSKVYASAASGLFQSTDSGVTWQILNSTIAAKTLTAFPDSKAAGDVALIAGTGTGAFLSVDGGITWSPSSNGLVGCRVLSLVSITDVHGMVVTCAGTDGMGAFLSTDVGVSWTPASGEIASSHVMALIAGKMGGIMPTLFAGAGEGIFQYDQAAGTWARMKTDSITYDVQTLVADGDSLVAGTWMGVFCLSADSVWRKRKSGWIDAMASDNEYLYAARGNVVSRSSDHGFHWEQAGGSLPAAITSMLSTPISGNGSPVLWGTTYNAGIMRSTDRGTSWSAMNGGLPDPKPEALCAARVGSGDGTLLVGTSLGMYRFDANAALWQPVSEGLPSTSVYACAENGGYTLAGTDRGVWRRPVSDLTAIANRGFAGPEVFFLSQNYPNPFNPVTMIRYELAERAPVTLTVYSVIGQFVSRLVNKIEGAGYHEVRFDASGLASGVYFYRLQAGSFVQSKKLVILK